MSSAAPQSIVTYFFSKYATVFLLFICVFSGGLLRIGSLAIIDVSPENFYLQDVPLLTSIDGYYYLNNAKQILAENYNPTDTLRAFPEGGQLPSIAPLPSYLVAYVAKFLSVDIHWTAAVIPSLLSLLICLPLFAFGNHWGGKITAYFSILITMTAYIYATRTSFGMLDTDCMNVTFPLAISLCAFKFGKTRGLFRYLFLLTGLVLTVLFLWWWDVAPSVVLAFSIFPFLISFIFFYRPQFTEGGIFCVCWVLCCTALIAYLGVDIVFNQAERLYDFFLYITKSKHLSTIFPNTSISNIEQGGLSFSEVAVSSVGNQFFLIIAFLGLFLLFWKNKREFLYLLPLLVVGLLSFTAIRFLLFLVPLAGLGFGYLINIIYQHSSNKRLAKIGSALVGIFILVSSLSDPPFRTSFFSPDVITGMHRIRQLTPQNATIYGWWDIGHLLVYWSERPTLADGMIHSGERTTYLAAPLVSKNYRFAANYMQFFGNYGVPGIKKVISIHGKSHQAGFAFLKDILQSGPDASRQLIAQSPLAKVAPPTPHNNWTEFFFPKDGVPVYAFFEDRMLKATFQRWLYWYGTWNTDSLSGEKTLSSMLISPIKYTKGKIRNSKFDLDDDTGMLSMPNAFTEPFQLGRLTWFDDIQYHSIDYKNNDILTTFSYLPDYMPDAITSPFISLSGNYCLEILPPPLMTNLQDVRLIDTLTKQLFLYKNTDSAKYFRLIDEKRLKYQLWQVLGEKSS